MKNQTMISILISFSKTFPTNFSTNPSFFHNFNGKSTISIPTFPPSFYLVPLSSKNVKLQYKHCTIDFNGGDG